MFQCFLTFCTNVSKFTRASVSVVAVAFFVWLTIAPQPIVGAVFVVDTTVDSAALTACTAAADDCSLRGAISAANALAGADTITLPAGIYTLTVTGVGENSNAMGDLDVAANSDITVNGANARTTVVRAGTVGGVSGNGIDRVFDNRASTSILTLNDVTVANGRESVDDGGGGIRSLGTLFVNRSTITLNRENQNFGGGIFISAGTATIINSTVSGNSVSVAGGGGIYVESNAVLNISNTTVSDNAAGVNSGGGGIRNLGTANVTNCTIFGNNAGASTAGGGGIRNSGTMNIRNTIVSDNTSPFALKDVAGTVVSGGTNLIKVQSTSIGWITSGANADLLNNANANLSGLQNNGGNTDTHASSLGSSALNAGQNCVTDATCAVFNTTALTTDQRTAGFPRLVNATVDIGAFEASGATAASISISGRVVTPHEFGLTNALVTLTDMQGGSRTVLTGKFGNFRFANVAAGETYILSVISKRYTFAPQIVTANEDQNNLNFAPQ